VRLTGQNGWIANRRVPLDTSCSAKKKRHERLGEKGQG
jgi:hypothetical protein